MTTETVPRAIRRPAHSVVPLFLAALIVTASIGTEAAGSSASGSSLRIKPGRATCVYDGNTLKEISVEPPRARSWFARRTTFARWQAVLERKDADGGWETVAATGFDPPFTRLESSRFKLLAPPHGFRRALPSDGYVRVRVEVRWQKPGGAVLGRGSTLTEAYGGSPTPGCESHRQGPVPPGASPVWWGNTERTSLSSDSTFVEVQRGLEPVVGDFDGDENVDILWYSSEGDEALWWGAGRLFEKTSSPVLAGGGLTPLSGDFDGDGYDDVFWYRAGSNNDFQWWGGPGRAFEVGSTSDATGTWDQLVAGDYNGDGPDDIYFYRNDHKTEECGNTLHTVYWWGKPDRAALHAGPTNTPAGSPRCYYKWFSADIDGNGWDDFLAYGLPPNSRDSVTFHGEPAEGIRFNQPWGLRPVAGDFDGDGRSDVFWFSPSGEDAQWWAPAVRSEFATGYRTALQIDGDYLPVSGDFDGDGKDDILWYFK